MDSSLGIAAQDLGSIPRLYNAYVSLGDYRARVKILSPICFVKVLEGDTEEM